MAIFVQWVKMLIYSYLDLKFKVGMTQVTEKNDETELAQL